MYSWFMPKDEPNVLEGAAGVGHRYDWENIVVVLSAESTSATLVGMAASAHGDYSACKGTACNQYLSGTAPLIQYYSEGGVLDHSLGLTTTVGGRQPLIAWDSLPAVASAALTNKDWGCECQSLILLWLEKTDTVAAATISFLDSDFDSYLSDAYEAIGI